MNWGLIVTLLAIAAGVLLVRRLALVSTKDACRYLQQGALIVDVRDPGEFSQRHVPGAVNIPLSGLPGNLEAQVTNKNQVLLLHCLSGGRSAVAKRVLRANGYSRAYNLGSYSRADGIARASRQKAQGPALPTSSSP